MAMSAGAAVIGTAGCQSLNRNQSTEASAFKTNFSAFYGQFEPVVGSDYMAQIDYAYANGFRIWEDIEIAKHSVEQQARYGNYIQNIGMKMGVCARVGDVAQTVLTSGDGKTSLLADLREALDVAERGGSGFVLVSAGAKSGNLQLDYQKANAVDVLREAATIAEANNKTLLVQPDASPATSVFLKSVPEVFEICALVNHPACALLYDVNHQQVGGGNIIANIEQSKSWTGYYQIGGSSMDGSLGSVELSYGKVVEAMRRANSDAIIGLSHMSGQNNTPTQRSKLTAKQSIQTCLELDVPLVV